MFSCCSGLNATQGPGHGTLQTPFNVTGETGYVSLGAAGLVFKGVRSAVRAAPAVSPSVPCQICFHSPKQSKLPSVLFGTPLRHGQQLRW